MLLAFLLPPATANPSLALHCLRFDSDARGLQARVSGTRQWSAVVPEHLEISGVLFQQSGAESCGYANITT